MPDPFFAIFSHTPARRPACASSQSSNSAAARNAITTASAASLPAGFIDTRDPHGRSGRRLGPAVVPGQDLAEVPGPVRDGAVADLAARDRKLGDGHGEAPGT